MQPDLDVPSSIAPQQVDRVRALLDQQGLEGVVLTAQDNVAWVTDGIENAVIRGTNPGLVWALVTRERAVLVTQNIEGPRLEAEEGAAAAGFEVVTFPWYEDAWARVTSELVPEEQLGNDGAGPGRPIAAELSGLKVNLTDHEQGRLASIARDAAVAVQGALREARPEQTERELAAEVVARLELNAIFPSVLLVGCDARRRRFRHPTISDARLESGVLAVLVGARDGLNVALSRTVAFGDPAEDLALRHEHASQVVAEEMVATAPGSTWGSALQAGIDAYERLGYPGEWRHHYQGGAIGYGPREFSPAPPEHPNAWTDFPVRAGQAGAWNPTIQGAKAEETFLVGEAGPELLTPTADWPTIAVPAGDGTLALPAILRVG